MGVWVDRPGSVVHLSTNENGIRPMCNGRLGRCQWVHRDDGTSVLLSEAGYRCDAGWGDHNDAEGRRLCVRCVASLTWRIQWMLEQARAFNDEQARKVLRLVVADFYGIDLATIDRTPL